MATNLWPNADFESGVSDWHAGSGTGTQSSEQAFEQTYSLKWTPTDAAYANWESDAKTIVSPSTDYVVSIYFYPTTTHDYQLQVYGDVEGLIGTASPGNLTGGEWTRVEVAVTTGASDSALNLRVRKANNVDLDPVYLDAVMVETGSGAASAWANYVSGATTAINPQLLTTSISMFNPLVTNVSPTLEWDAGAYIYTGDASGVSIAPPVLRTQLAIHNPVVYAVDVPTAITPNLMTTQLTMLSPSVSVTTGQSGSRICRFLHLVMGR